MKRVLALFALLLFCSISHGQRIDPRNGINWPVATGSGTPTATSASCTALNYGQPYDDTSTNPVTLWICTASGWQKPSGSPLTLQHDGTNLPDQSLLNFVDSPNSLSPPSLDPNYQPVIFKNGTYGGVGAETLQDGSSWQAFWAPPTTGNSVVLYPTSAVPYPTAGTQCSASAQTSAPFSGSIGRSNSGPIGGTTCTIDWTGFGINGTSGLPAGVSPSNVTAVYWGLTSVVQGNRASGQSISISCTGGGSSEPILPYGATWPAQTTFSPAFTSSLGSINYSALSCTVTDSSSRDCTAPGQTCPSESQWQPFALVYYTGTAVPSTTTVQVASPLTFFQNTLGLQWPYNVCQDTQSSTEANKYLCYLPALNQSVGINVGTQIMLQAATANTTGAPTLQFQGSDATITVKGQYGATLANGDISSSAIAILVMDEDGTFHLQNPQVTATSGVTSLTTTGTGGPATLSAGVLNVPQYQQALTLTTSGTSGPATLSAGALNIPQYSGGSSAVTPAGVFPSGAALIFTGDSYNDDDEGVIETPVATSGYTCTGSGTFTCVVNTTLSTAVGDWINMRGTTDFSPGNAHFPSYLEIGTGYSLFQVTASTPGTSFTFTETLGAYTCSSTCGTVAAANDNLPFQTWHKLGFGSDVGVVMALPNPVNIAGLDTNFTSLFPSESSPCYFVIGGLWNDIQGGATAATIEGHLQSIWAKVHTLGCQVVMTTSTAALVAQSSFGYPDEYRNLVSVEQWNKTQGPQYSLISGGQYWDLLVDLGSALHDARDSAQIATNTGLGPAGADIASSQIASVLFSGKSSMGYNLPLYFAAPEGSLNTNWVGLTVIPTADSYNIFGVQDAEGNTVLNIDTEDSDHTMVLGNNGGNVALNVNVTDNHESALTVSSINPGGSAGDPIETLTKTFHIETGTGWSNDISTLWQYDTSNYDGVNFGAAITSLGSATLNGGFAEINGAPYDNFHFDGTGDSCFYVKTLANLNAATDPVCPTSKAFSVGTTGQMWVDSSGNTNVQNLTVNGTCTGCGGGGSGTVTSVAMTMPGAIFNTSVSGSPITTSGTFAPSLLTQTANTVFAGPTTGSAATPTFRALVSADIPNNAANTSGTAANLSGTPALPNGTTATTQTSGDSTTKLATDNFVETAIAGLPYTVCASNGQFSNTGSTSETNLYNCTIAAGMMGANSRLAYISNVHNGAESTGTCTLHARFSSTSGTTSLGTMNATVTTAGASHALTMHGDVGNANSVSSQYYDYMQELPNGTGGGNSLYTAFSLNTSTTTTYLVFNLTNSVSGDTCYLDTVSVVLWPNG